MAIWSLSSRLLGAALADLLSNQSLDEDITKAAELFITCADADNIFAASSANGYHEQAHQQTKALRDIEG